ncbi:hypothetical protein PQG46_13010, partial [Aquirufa nivalisilvae]
VLYKAESSTVSATDGTISSTGGDRLSVTVSPASYSKLAVSLATPQVNGTAFTGTNTLTAQDAYGNTVSSFDASANNVTVTSTLTGTISGLGSGVNNLLNQAGDFVSGVANLTTKLIFTGTVGTGTFTFTPQSGTGVTSGSVQINSGAATHMMITGNASQNAGESQTITIRAVDASHNTATGYTGTKSLTFSGANSSSSPVTVATANGTDFGTSTSIVFTNGVATASVVLYKAESALLTASDGTIHATGNSHELAVTVSPATFSKLAVSLASPQVNGTAFTGTNTLTAQDAYGNTVSNFDASANNVTVTTSLTGAISGLSGTNKLSNAGDFVSGVANLTSLGLIFTGTTGAGTFTFTPVSGTAITSSSVTVNPG